MENGEQSAFPLDSKVPWATGVRIDGLTKREYFAGLFVQAILTANHPNYFGNREGQAVPIEVIKDALAQADELLKQLQEK